MIRRRVAAGLVLTALAGLDPFGVSAQPPRPMPPAVSWVDVHVHLIGGRDASADVPGAVEAAVRVMDRFGIGMAIVLPPPQVDAQAPTDDHQRYAGELRRHPGRFAFLGGGGSLNSMIHRHADPAMLTEQVNREFAAEAERILDGGASGFGEMASLHLSAAPGHPYEFVPADHPLFLVLADVAARRGVPIDLHMDAVDGETPTPARFAGGANPPRLPDTLGALARLLAHSPTARIVWAHGGSDPVGAMSPSTIGRLMDAHPNLFVSLRIVGAQAPMENTALARGGLDPAWRAVLTRHADRFVIGTDSFFASPSLRGRGPGLTFAERNEPKLQATVHFLSLLPAEIVRKIGRDNAVRLYHLRAA